MGKYINNYASQAAYNADNGRTTETSAASLVGEVPVIDGVNVIKPSRDFLSGDAVVFDKVEGCRKLIHRGTLKKALLDTVRFFNCNATIVGAIFGKVVTIDDNRLPAKPFAAPDEWTISGINLAAAGSFTIVVKYHSAAAEYTKTITLSWAAGDTVESLIATLNATSGFASYCKAYKVNATSLYITVSGYSANMGITLSDGAVNLERTYWGYQTRYYDGGRYTTQIERNNGVVSYWAMSNFDRFYTHYSANGVQVASTIGGDTVRRTAFTEETNPDLYEQFGGDYDAYMAAQFDAIKAKFPCNRYGIKDFAFGEADLAMVSHINPVGDIVWDFPNAHDAYLSGVTLEGFETGFEPGKATNGGLAEAHLLYSQVKAGNTDPINKTIIANGGTAADNGTTIRLAFQSNASAAWIFYGGSGSLSYGDGRVTAWYGRGFRAFNIEDF